MSKIKYSHEKPKIGSKIEYTTGAGKQWEVATVLPESELKELSIYYKDYISSSKEEIYLSDFTSWSSVLAWRYLEEAE